MEGVILAQMGLESIKAFLKIFGEIMFFSEFTTFDYGNALTYVGSYNYRVYLATS